MTATDGRLADGLDTEDRCEELRRAVAGPACEGDPATLNRPRAATAVQSFALNVTLPLWHVIGWIPPVVTVELSAPLTL